MGGFIIFHELVAQTKLLNIDPLVKRKLFSWCASLYMQGEVMPVVLAEK